MAAPITRIAKREPTSEEQKQQKLAELETLLTEQDEAINKILQLTGELNDAGILDAVNAMVKARDNITGIAVQQASRKPVTNLLNHLLNAAGALAAIDPAATAKLSQSVRRGLDEADRERQSDKKIGVFGMVKAVRDPDINRSIRFGVSFLKGMGKGLR
ncbi:DUF1641 domain-containing protein [Planococcus lenghuensis]|uniref:DUF1641 domain-containing protein n=1 Tax=Planococcus lenghuensis TaxID=2213202 RepID=A0A1Q2L3Y1_9BACL|nr:DUF1641 domain-containing protein [Planococcus lenghuensis]AQQ55131.1 hypothetical protein B0X71_14015 [Planococcus lenghuensis]